MNLTEEERSSLTLLYLEKAEETMQEVEVAVAAKKWNMAANRLYYALFHAATALFVSDGRAVGTHLGAKVTLGIHYVRTGVLTREQGRLFSRLETLRERADYDGFFSADESDVTALLPQAYALFERLRELSKTV